MAWSKYLSFLYLSMQCYDPRLKVPVNKDRKLVGMYINTANSFERPLCKRRTVEGVESYCHWRSACMGSPSSLATS